MGMMPDEYRPYFKWIVIGGIAAGVVALVVSTF